MCSRPNPQENIPPMAERIARKGTSFYGQRHLCFLQHYRKVTYINLLMSVNLNEYLAEIDRQAQKRFLQIVEQMKQKQRIAEQLKVNNPMEWTGKMNCIKQQAEENIITEIVYN